MSDVEQVLDDVLNEMYENATPPLDFDDVQENPEDYPDDWFRQHTLPREKEQEILDKHIEKHDLAEKEETALHWQAVLNLGPSYPEDDATE